ncbi:hypothetical protein AAY84_13735 [Serratia marcescens]|nr:hypothetical protein AAY84_13735 [Serratia marcescens]
MWVFMSYYHGYSVVVFTVFSLLFPLFTVLLTASWLVKHHFNLFSVLLYALVFHLIIVPGSPQDAFSDAGMVTCEYFHFVAQNQVGGLLWVVMIQRLIWFWLF